MTVSDFQLGYQAGRRGELLPEGYADSSIFSESFLAGWIAGTAALEESQESLPYSSD